jgi:hypothetical protein
MHANAKSRIATMCNRGLEPKFAILLLLLIPIPGAATELKPATLQAWESYVHEATQRAEGRARGRGPFLWVDENPDRLRRVRAGEVLVEPDNGESPRSVPHGLIHDWIGAVFIPQAKFDETMDLMDNYDRYKDYYRPMVVRSKLLERSGDEEKVSLTMMQRAYGITAAVETENSVEIVRVDQDRAYSLSRSVQVREIADYGKPSEHALPEDDGPGYVWRTLTITRLERRDDGIYYELEMLALSRSIPLAFRWLVQSLAERLPRNILMATLSNTREVVREPAHPSESLLK